MDTLQALLAPYYIYIKYIHIISVMIWSCSTIVAWLWFVKPAHIKAKQSPSNQELARRKIWAYVQFDRGVTLEHITLPIILITGPMLYLAAGWTLDSSWLLVKLIIVIAVFLPIEIVDYYLSHGPGNKHYLKTHAPEKLDKMIDFHWKFINLVTFPLALGILATVTLAIIKPTLW